MYTNKIKFYKNRLFKVGTSLLDKNWGKQGLTLGHIVLCIGNKTVGNSSTVGVLIVDISLEESMCRRLPHWLNGSNCKA